MAMVVGELDVIRVVGVEVQDDPVLLLGHMSPLAGQSAIE